MDAQKNWLSFTTVLFFLFLFFGSVYTSKPTITLAATRCIDVPGVVVWGYGDCPGPGHLITGPTRACNTPGGERCVSCSMDTPLVHGYACQGVAVVPDDINTEIGKISAKPEKLVEAFSRILVYLGGGVSLFLLLSGAIKYLFSSGNPETIEEAKGIITSALGGFLLVFLSVFLLRFMGVDVLHIPGFELAPRGGVDVPYTP